MKNKFLFPYKVEDNNMKKELDKKNKEVIILQREVEALQEVKEENKRLHDLLKTMSQKRADVIKENEALKQEKDMLNYDLKVANMTIELERGLKEKNQTYLRETEEELEKAQEELRFYKNLDMWGMKLADLYDLTQEKSSVREQLAKQSSEAAYWKDESLRLRERLMDANDQYRELEHRVRVLEGEVNQILG
jgi:hypothetical protein